MDYGYDCNGRKITITKEYFCDGCGKSTGQDLSDGSMFSGSCGCDYLKEKCGVNTSYLVVKHRGRSDEVLIIKGYKQTKERFDRWIETGQAATMAEIVKSNV